MSDYLVSFEYTSQLHCIALINMNSTQERRIFESCSLSDLIKYEFFARRCYDVAISASF